MSLFERIEGLLHEALTIHRFSSVSQRGVDTFKTSTESVSPVRLTRDDRIMYDNGREVRTRGKILMPLPSGGAVGKRDKLVMDEGEEFRVFDAKQIRDKDGNPYQIVIVT